MSEPAGFPASHPSDGADQPPVAAAEPAYGGFWRRTVAYLADVAVLAIPYLVIETVAVLLDPAGVAATVIGLAYSAATLAYYAVFWSRTGSTPAMRALGLKVVREHDGSLIGVGRGVWRSFAIGLVSIPLGLGLLWVAFDRRKRGWHDMLAKTVVIRTAEASRTWRVLTYIAAAALIVLTVVFVALIAIYYSAPLARVATQTLAETARPITQPTEMALEELRTGHCFSPIDIAFERVEAVPCDEPHILELAAILDLPAGEFPATVEEQDQMAFDACDPEVGFYVGFDAEDELYIGYLGLDSEAAWEAGDRRLWCFIQNENATPVEGSARDGWD